MKDNSGYGNIPHAFFDFITFLTDALPLRSMPTFIELLNGKWSWVNIARHLMRMLTVFFPEEERFLVLDDTLLFLSSKKAPGSHIYHQHRSKENRPQYVRGQNWVWPGCGRTRFRHGINSFALKNDEKNRQQQ